MQRTITLEHVTFDQSWDVKFSDKSFGTPSPADLEVYSNEVLEEISGKLLRSLLFIEYIKNGITNISATINTDDPNGIWVKLNG
jgi:hypothetical protein